MVLLDLMGGVALLLWGLHMVQTGILRAFGSELRHLLSKALGNRIAALAAGLGLTTLLQSSTATALMTASFTAQGLVGLVPALAILLGANIGTAFIVQLLSFNVAAAAPALFVIGVVAFRAAPRTRIRDLGRVAIGLGLVVLALHILIDTLAPAENAPFAREVLRTITGDPVMCVLLAAALTWAAHSSVATVLLIMSLGYSNFVTPSAAFALVLGANLGTTINPLFEATLRGDPASYRLPVGNLLNRLVGIALVAPFLHPLADAFRSFQPDMAMMTAEFHVAFNVVLALLFIGLLDPLAALLIKLFPARRDATDPASPRYLDAAGLEMPSLALAGAARETLRMADIVEVMLCQVMTALLNNDRALVREVSRMDNVVDKLDEAIKLHITRLTRGSLDERDARRAMEIISFSINLEHVGDIIDKNLTELAAKKIRRKFQFSDEGASELAAFHERIVKNFRIALAVFMSGDIQEARRLISEKAELRSAELAAAERHLERLRAGRPETLETTSLHLDVLRDLKRIHSHICSVAYPVLDAAKVDQFGFARNTTRVLEQPKPSAQSQ
jgi:phosphate:Na+ symporter